MAEQTPPTDLEFPCLVPLGEFHGYPPVLLDRPVTIAGSRGDANLRLIGDDVSRSHALFLSARGQVLLRDLASKTHIFVNNQRIRDSNLRDGDIIRIGRFTFRFRPGASVEPPNSPEPLPLRLNVEGLGVLPLDAPVTVIGRRKECDITLSDELVSTAHAVIFHFAGRHYIRDLGTVNGTFVNSQRVLRVEITAGDVIRIGAAVMRCFEGLHKPPRSGHITPQPAAPSAPPLADDPPRHDPLARALEALDPPPRIEPSQPVPPLPGLMLRPEEILHVHDSDLLHMAARSQLFPELELPSVAWPSSADLRSSPASSEASEPEDSHPEPQAPSPPEARIEAVAAPEALHEHPPAAEPESTAALVAEPAHEPPPPPQPAPEPPASEAEPEPQAPPDIALEIALPRESPPDASQAAEPVHQLPNAPAPQPEIATAPEPAPESLTTPDLDPEVPPSPEPASDAPHALEPLAEQAAPPETVVEAPAPPSTARESAITNPESEQMDEFAPETPVALDLPNDRSPASEPPDESARFTPHSEAVSPPDPAPADMRDHVEPELRPLAPDPRDAPTAAPAHLIFDHLLPYHPEPMLTAAPSADQRPDLAPPPTPPAIDGSITPDDDPSEASDVALAQVSDRGPVAGISPTPFTDHPIQFLEQQEDLPQPVPEPPSTPEPRPDIPADFPAPQAALDSAIPQAPDDLPRPPEAPAAPAEAPAASPAVADASRDLPPPLSPDAKIADQSPPADDHPPPSADGFSRWEILPPDPLRPDSPSARELSRRRAPRPSAPPRPETWGPLAAAVTDSVPPSSFDETPQRYRLPLLLLLMLLAMLLAAIVVWKFALPEVLVEGEFRFERLAQRPISTRERFEGQQWLLLRDPEVLDVAVRLMSAMHPDADPGFLTSPSTRVEMRWTHAVEENVSTLLLRHRGHDSALDPLRLRALLQALYTAEPNRERFRLAALAEKRLEDSRAALAEAQREMDDLLAEKRRLQTLGDERPEFSSLAALRSAVERQDAAWTVAIAARKSIQAELEQLQQLPAGQADAEPAPEGGDSEIARLLERQAELAALLHRARSAAADEVAEKRAAVAASIDQFQTTLAVIEGMMNDTPILSDHIASAQKLHEAAWKLQGDLIVRQEQQQKQLIEYKRRLEEQIAKRRRAALERDPEISRLNERLSEKTRQRAAAATAGRSADAQAIDREIEALLQHLEARRMVVGNDRFYSDAVEGLKQIIDSVQRQLDADRAATEEMMAGLETTFRQTSPEVELLPQQQRAAAERLGERVEALRESRKAHAAAVAAQSAEANDELKRLEAGMTSLREALTLRRQALASEHQQRLTEHQSAAIERKRKELSEAESAEQTARETYRLTLRRLDAALERDAAWRASRDELEQLVTEREPAARDRLAAAHRQADAAAAELAAIALPLMPAPAQVVQISDYRAHLVTAAVLFVGLLFAGWMFWSARRPPARRTLAAASGEPARAAPATPSPDRRSLRPAGSSA